MGLETEAMKKLAEYQWVRRGKQLMANGDFNPVERKEILDKLGALGKGGIGLEFVGSKAYIDFDSQGVFKAEGCPLQVCVPVAAR